MREWSIEGEAKKLCGCHLCSGFGTPEERCRRLIYERGIRAGLAKAAEVAAINDACMMCETVLMPTAPLCEDGCLDEYDEAKDGSPVATADRIRALLK